jgi:diguanylate cyclase
MITSHYNIPLVILSISIAVISSYTSLNIVNRLIVSKGSLRKVWLSAGAFSLGFGIWSMHFVAMLAMHLSIPVTYDIFLVVLSIIAAVVSCGIAFFIVSRGLRRKFYIFVGAIFIGTGVVSMHYIGMEAMNMEATIQYDPFLLVLSFIIAFFAALAALFLLFSFQTGADVDGFSIRKMLSSVAMGIAISGMHYTGMAAASFDLDPNHTHHTMGTSINSDVMAYVVGLGMIVILGCVIVSIYLDRRFQSKTSQLEFMDNIYQSLIMTANDAIILGDSKGNIISWNRAAEAIFGYKEKEVIGKPLQLIIPPHLREAHQQGINRYLATNVPHVMGKTLELLGLRKNGEEFPIELSLSTLRKGEEILFSGIVRDISERKESEAKINELVYRDPLTNLPNRRFLNNHLAMCIEQASLNHQMLAVMFIDLDRFKYVNDTLGHGSGDALLVEAAARMESCIEKKDMLARQGGDEYILIFPHTPHQKVANIAKSILEKLNEPFVIDHNEVFISGSIGISMYPADGEDAEVLIKNADTSMYRAKELGKNNYQFYTPDMNELMAKKMNLELGLRRALENEEFELYYQPQIDVKTGELEGVEALIRWKHPELGLVAPNEFIPLAEETGLIVPIGNWVIRAACEQAKCWVDSGRPNIRIGINISARQFQQPDFVETVERILEETKLDARYLDLELTESIIQNPEYALPVMEQLKLMGVKLSLDDFGTGYSSLSYLRSFPLDSLKIDRSFIQSVNQEVKDEAIVKTIINLASSLNLNVIAEGVETTDQLQLLNNLGCNEYQGYLYSRPVPASELVMHGDGSRAAVGG